MRKIKPLNDFVFKKVFGEKGKIEAAMSFLDILDDETIANKLGLELNLVRALRSNKN